LGVDQALVASGVESTDGTSEVRVSEGPKSFATQYKFSGVFSSWLHDKRSALAKEAGDDAATTAFSGRPM